MLGPAMKGGVLCNLPGVSVSLDTLGCCICRERFYLPVHLTPGYLPATQHGEVHVNRV